MKALSPSRLTLPPKRLLMSALSEGLQHALIKEATVSFGRRNGLPYSLYCQEYRDSTTCHSWPQALQ